MSHSDRADTRKIYRDKILRVFEVYPRLSPSMLHIGIGPSTPSAIYKPILQELIDEGIIRSEVIAVAGSRGYTVLSLCEPTATLKTLS